MAGVSVTESFSSRGAGSVKSCFSQLQHSRSANGSAANNMLKRLVILFNQGNHPDIRYLSFLHDHTGCIQGQEANRSEEHKSELQSLMRISYAGCCLKTNKTNTAKYIKQYKHN